MPRNSLLSVYGTLQPDILMPRRNGRIYLLTDGMILIRYLIWGRGHVCDFSSGCCRRVLTARVIGVIYWHKRIMLTCELAESPDNGGRRTVLDICSWTTFACLYSRLDQLPCFKLLDFIGQRTWWLWKLPSKKFNQIEN